MGSIAHLSIRIAQLFFIGVGLLSGSFAAWGASHSNPTLILTGDCYVTIVEFAKLPSEEYNYSYLKGKLWEWDARTTSYMLGLPESSMFYIDDAKPVDSGDCLLVTSSAHWAALVDYATKKPVWYTSQSRNAHSAEMLPGGRIVVACSTSSGGLQLYDREKPNQLLYETPMADAHGVVWDEKRQRLYANGADKINVYRLGAWNTDNPRLEFERAITTPKKSTHDLSRVDENTLLVAGKGAYFMDLDTYKFTALSFFAKQTAIKSMNYNKTTGEMWYTDSTNAEGDYDWSTQTVHHTLAPSSGPDHCKFKTLGLNLYKVRVLEWNKQASEVKDVVEDLTDADCGQIRWFDMNGMESAFPVQGFNIKVHGRNVEKFFMK